MLHNLKHWFTILYARYLQVVRKFVFLHSKLAVPGESVGLHRRQSHALLFWHHELGCAFPVSEPNKNGVTDIDNMNLMTLMGSQSCELMLPEM